MKMGTLNRLGGLRPGKSGPQRSLLGPLTEKPPLGWAAFLLPGCLDGLYLDSPTVSRVL